MNRLKTALQALQDDPLFVHKLATMLGALIGMVVAFFVSENVEYDDFEEVDVDEVDQDA